MYKAVSNSDEWESFDIDSKTNYTIPIIFEIWKNENSKRRLGLINPFSQLNIHKFVDKYSFDILTYCNNNGVFSIRYPTKTNTLTLIKTDVLSKQMKVLLNENEEYRNNDSEEFLDSNFVKYRYNRITDFFKDNLFKSLELKYGLLLRIDLQSCFDHIYTHSIDWAYLGDKDLAKQLIGHSNRFSSILDSIMQKCNYNETNGIITGPEFSRIVAEIILMRVDMMVYTELKKDNVIHHVDYEVVRFIDDIFIFSNNQYTISKIRALYVDFYSKYKLDLNYSKEKIETRPFIRERFWVPKFKNILNQYFNNLNTDNKRIITRLNMNLIDDFRLLLSDYITEKEKIVSYLMIAFENRLESIFININKFEPNLQSYYLSALIDILHYSLVFSITSSHVNTFIRIITKFTYFSQSNNLNFFLEILHKKCNSLLKQYGHTHSIELNNLILFIRRIEKDISEKVLLQILQSNPDYFTLGAIMFYISSTDRRYRYKSLKVEINKIIRKIIIRINKNYFSSTAKLQTKDFIMSQDFLPIHDFGDHFSINKENKVQIASIKKYILDYSNSFKKTDSILSFYIKYISNFDKPFFNINLEDVNVIELLILKNKNDTSTYH